MIAAWCFQCQLDYSPDVAECLECGSPTVGHAPADPAVMANSERPQVAYELHGWNGPARAEVENRLHAGAIAHSWQGPTLLVYEDDEDVADDIFDAIDGEMTTGAESGTASEDGRVGFDLGARSEALHQAVSTKLASAEVKFELTGTGYLLVASVHEDQVAEWIEEIQTDLRATATFGDGVEGVSGTQVVEAMFLASDTLRRNTRDLKAQRQMLDAESLARDLKLPFGYDAPMWRGVLDQAAVIVALIEDAADDSLLEAEARQFRDMLHPYV